MMAVEFGVLMTYFIVVAISDHSRMFCPERGDTAEQAIAQFVEHDPEGLRLIFAVPLAAATSEEACRTNSGDPGGGSTFTWVNARPLNWAREILANST